MEKTNFFFPFNIKRLYLLHSLGTKALLKPKPVWLLRELAHISTRWVEAGMNCQEQFLKKGHSKEENIISFRKYICSLIMKANDSTQQLSNLLLQ